MQSLIERLKAAAPLNMTSAQVKFTDLQEAISALEAASAWRSKDYPPSDNRDVLVCDMNCTNDYAYPYKPADSRCIGFYENGKWYHGMDTDKMEMDSLTHWIDVGLPAPPKEQEGK